MIEIFLEATDFQNIFEDHDSDKASPTEKLLGSDGCEILKDGKYYWERVFHNATSDAHKLFRSQKNKMYIESFEEILRKILRYRNNKKDTDNKFRMD